MKHPQPKKISAIQVGRPKLPPVGNPENGVSQYKLETLYALQSDYQAKVDADEWDKKRLAAITAEIQRRTP